MEAITSRVLLLAAGGWGGKTRQTGHASSGT